MNNGKQQLVKFSNHALMMLPLLLLLVFSCPLKHAVRSYFAPQRQSASHSGIPVRYIQSGTVSCQVADTVIESLQQVGQQSQSQSLLPLVWVLTLALLLGYRLLRRTTTNTGGTISVRCIPLYISLRTLRI